MSPNGGGGRAAEAAEERENKVRETIIVIVLSLTAVLTAWSGFENSKWSGNMSTNFSKASSQRIEASRHATHADARRAIDLQVFGIYIQAVAQHDRQLAQFARARFTPEFDVAFKQWKAMNPLTNASAPESPFSLDSYVPPGTRESAAASARADGFFQEALADNQRGDRYTMLTVLFALVLFFAAIATRIRARILSWVLVLATSALMIVGIGLIVSMPKLW